MDLFPEPRRIELADAEVFYHPCPDLGAKPDQLFALLRKQLPFEQHAIRVEGRVVPQPRLSSWHGDVLHKYPSLAQVLLPHPWSPVLDSLRARIQDVTGGRFNSLLANLYRDGQDAIGWHSDDEPELGPQPMIASLSLGAERKFDMRRRDDHRCKAYIVLEHGSLLVMGGTMQRYWQHAMARTSQPVGERINLTFRLTLPRSHWRKA